MGISCPIFGQLSNTESEFVDLMKLTPLGSPHHHITTSPHHHITTSPHHNITTSQHHHIWKEHDSSDKRVTWQISHMTNDESIIWQISHVTNDKRIAWQFSDMTDDKRITRQISHMTHDKRIEWQLHNQSQAKWRTNHKIVNRESEDKFQFPLVCGLDGWSFVWLTGLFSVWLVVCIVCWLFHLVSDGWLFGMVDLFCFFFFDFCCLVGWLVVWLWVGLSVS